MVIEGLESVKEGLDLWCPAPYPDSDMAEYTNKFVSMTHYFYSDADYFYKEIFRKEDGIDVKILIMDYDGYYEKHADFIEKERDSEEKSVESHILYFLHALRFIRDPDSKGGWPKMSHQIFVVGEKYLEDVIYKEAPSDMPREPLVRVQIVPGRDD